MMIFELIRNPVMLCEFMYNYDKLETEEPFELTWYQKEILLDFSNYVSIVEARATGKTMALTALILWLLIFKTFPEDYIVYTVPSKVHLEPVFSNLIRMLRSNTFLRHFIERAGGINSSDFTIKLTNQSLLMCRIAGQTGTGATVIGLHSPFVIVDESGYYPWGTWVELQPTLNTFTDGYKLMVAGVPTGIREKSVNYHCDQEDSNYSKHHITAYQNPRFTDEDKRKAIDQYGGEDSDDYIHLVCFAPNTPIITDNDIKDIVDIQVGDTVLTHKGGWGKVVKTFERDYNGDAIEIKTEHLYKPIICTPDHPIYGMKLKKVTWSGNKPYAIWKGNLNKNIRPNNIKSLFPSFIAAKEYTALDRVSFPNVKYTRHLPKYIDFSEFGVVKEGSVYASCRTRNESIRSLRGKFIKRTELDSDLLFLLGLFTAEGSNHEERGQCSIALNILEQGIVDKSKRVLDTLGLHYWETFAGNGRYLVFSSVIFSKFISKYIGHGAHNKHVPSFLVGVTSQELLPYLEGLFAGDGSLSLHNKDMKQTYTTVSKDLAYGILHILYGFSIHPSLIYSAGGKEIQIYHNAKKTTTTGCYTIALNVKEIKTIYCNLKDTFDTFDNGDLSIRIRNIKTIPYSGKVYNLEVEGDNSYVTCGFSAHNCAEHGKPIFSLFDRSSFLLKSEPVYKLELSGLQLQENLSEYLTKISSLPSISDKRLRTIMGIDLGYTEPTAIQILYLDSEDRIHFHARIRMDKVSYTIQEKLIDILDTKYNPIIIGMDKGNSGMSTLHHLQNDNDYIHKNYTKRLIPIDFSSSISLGFDSEGKEIKNKTKPFSVSALQDYSNNQKIIYSTMDLEMVTELERMTYSKSVSGDITYKTLTVRGGKRGEDHFTSALLCGVLAYYLENESFRVNTKQKSLLKPIWV